MNTVAAHASLKRRTQAISRLNRADKMRSQIPGLTQASNDFTTFAGLMPISLASRPWNL
jgi:hypothetical protein